MKNCKNKEHKRICKRKGKCLYCGLDECAANFGYHVCVSKKK